MGTQLSSHPFFFLLVLVLFLGIPSANINSSICIITHEICNEIAQTLLAMNAQDRQTSQDVKSKRQNIEMKMLPIRLFSFILCKTPMQNAVKTTSIIAIAIWLPMKKGKIKPKRKFVAISNRDARKSFKENGMMKYLSLLSRFFPNILNDQAGYGEAKNGCYVR